ncbi:hypothetical protein [Amycolatopsis sp. BJA-103]|uniref:hypothetical protein n=1 Tax=Amycolatopsis sp. BJA-103 TaxID=1911175 RepID=UPI000C775BB8|nr:hypothetical protein [Amycolatopsis sp. BJA-103]AUI58427.1 hypothetical protein BKN51_09505 [Amycolatopsis sp. BJA-103]PNE15105.1 hypothetical protein B1H26_31490 [Amycolatopsis sp. BJA-103]
MTVSVAYNYSGPRHLETYLSDAEHSIVRAPLHAEAPAPRRRTLALCWTPARARHLLFPRLSSSSVRETAPARVLPMPLDAAGVFRTVSRTCRGVRTSTANGSAWWCSR